MVFIHFSGRFCFRFSREDRLPLKLSVSVSDKIFFVEIAAPLSFEIVAPLFVEIVAPLFVEIVAPLFVEIVAPLSFEIVAFFFVEI